MTTEHLRHLDHRHLWHPFTHMKLWLADDPLVIVAAEGMHLIDSDGNRYLDGVSSLWCNVHGHRVKEIDDAIRAQLDKVAHSTVLGLASEPAILLADRLMRLVPKNLTKIFYSDAGATATEIAFKMAVQYWHNVGKPEKREFVALGDAYHGDTFGAMSVGCTEFFHRPYLPMLFKTHVAPTPFPYRCPLASHCNCPRRDELSRLDCVGQSLHEMRNILQLNKDRIAAVCVEPIVQGAAGMIVHPAGFLRGVRKLCDEFDVLLIADEVATGFGRTGRMFACEHEDVQPDLMCVAKGITGGYLPLAATFATQKIFDSFLGEPWEGRTFFHGHTYTGNALGCAAALASLDLFEKNDVINSVASKSIELVELLRDELGSLPCVGEIRQMGFMVGIELVQDRATKRPFNSRRRVGAAVCLAMRRHGVILRPLLDTLVLMPPLAMSMEDLQHIVKSLREELLRVEH